VGLRTARSGHLIIKGGSSSYFLF